MTQPILIFLDLTDRACGNRSSLAIRSIDLPSKVAANSQANRVQIEAKLSIACGN